MLSQFQSHLVNKYACSFVLTLLQNVKPIYESDVRNNLQEICLRDYLQDLLYLVLHISQD